MRILGRFIRGGGSEEEEEEGGGIPVKTWRGDVSGSVVSTYNVGISTIKIVDMGASYMYVVEDPPVPEKSLKKLGAALAKISEEVEDPGLFLDLNRREEASKYLRGRLAKLGIKDATLIALAERELLGFGPLDPVLRDKKLENVECKGPDLPLNVVHAEYGRLETNMKFSKGELDKLIQRLVFLTGKTISVSNPKIDNAFLQGVGRLTATFGEEISRGSSFVVRIFPEKPWTVLGLLERGTVSPELLAYLWLAVEYKMPILIAGEMGSGKTSYANAILGLAPPDKRIGTAEDIPEFRIPHKNWQAYYTDDRRGIGLMDLVALLLRANVDYVVINEIRGARNQKGEVDAAAWFQAVATGHGGVTTIHADTVEDVFNRLDHMGIPPAYLTSLALVVYIGRFRIGGRIQRRTQYVFDIIDPSKRLYNVLFEYERDGDRYVVKGLESARTTQRIMELAKWDLEKFKSEYAKRVDFLNRLMCLNRKKPIQTLDELADLFARFYRGYVPEVSDCPPPKQQEVRRAEGVAADWILKFKLPRGRKVIYFEPSPGLTLLNVEGASKVVEEEVFELKARGSGELRYRVELDGKVIDQKVVPLLKSDARLTTPTQKVDALEAPRMPAPPAPQPGGERLQSEETVVWEETRLLEETLVASDMCIKFGGGVLKLVDGKIYGRADFAFLGDLSTYVSRQHFKALLKEGRWYLEDLGSRNGLYINGVRASPGTPVEIAYGARIKVGKAEGVAEPC
ncbi:MAG: ATPase, T2SS/T4P/T4SS family [Thermoproteus sp.]